MVTKMIDKQPDRITAKFIPPPNDQKEDTEWNWGGFTIKGGSQCQGNCSQDLVHAIGLEFGVKEFVGWSTYDYYTHFFGYLSKSYSPERTDLMRYVNHAWFMTELFKSYKIPVEAVARDLPNKPYIIRKAIEVTGRPVSIGMRFTQSGHWIRVHAYENGQFECNDPYGKHPYKGYQKGGFVKYSEDYLQKNTITRIITLEDK